MLTAFHGVIFVKFWRCRLDLKKFYGPQDRKLCAIFETSFIKPKYTLSCFLIILAYFVGKVSANFIYALNFVISHEEHTSKVALGP